jgi:hypothetical protein
MNLCCTRDRISARQISNRQDELGIALQASAIFAIEEFAHRFPPGLAHFGVQVLLGGGIFRFGFTAAWAAVGKTGFIRLQLEFFRADGACFNRERHNPSIVTDALQLL